MKKQLIYIGMAVALGFGSCTKDFEQINTDPTKASPEVFDPNYFLSNSVWTYVDQTMGYNGPMLFQSGWAQIIASTSSGGANYYSNADKYVPSSGTTDYMGRSWNGCYRAASLANEVINVAGSNPELVNVTGAATIVKVMSIMYVTDMYGDCPYTEALQAKAGITQPAYDPQQTVYTNMFNDLEAALNGMDASKAKPSADILPYKGDVAQWKKFGYSLMLKMAMRLVKVDPAMAKTYAEKAAAAGVFASVADNAYVMADNANGYRNDYARDLTTPADFYQVRWSKTFIDYLRETNDPRLGIIAEVPQDGLAANQNVGLAGISTPSLQMGLPNGYDLNNGATDISTSPSYPGGTGSGSDFTPIGKYSRPTTSIYGNYSGPIFILTYPETELLLAEAVVRGFNVGGTAAAHYANAVAGALTSLSVYGSAATISETTATAYAAANPLDASSTESSLQMINEQYWATCGSFLNFSEAWTNWRRSDYPVLTPVNYTGNFSQGMIPVRQPYPLSEAILNTANYQEAVSRQGADTWTTHVWWDVQ